MHEASLRLNATRRVALATSIPFIIAFACAHAQEPRDHSSVKTRKAVTDPASTKEGTYFRFHERALAHEFPEKYHASLAENRAILMRKSADELAREYVEAYDGASSDELTASVLRQVAGNDDPQLDAALRRTRNVIQMPDGNRVALPVLNSYALHLWLMRSTAEALRHRPVGPRVAGNYSAEVDGDCPFSAGPVTLTQRDSLVEGTRDDRLLLGGALGGTAAAFVASETRYLSTTIVQERVTQVAVPDRPSEIYQAPLGSSTLRLIGTTSRSCSIVLRPLP
jgi:hypothetical protein